MDILKYLGKIFVEIGIVGSVISFILHIIKIKINHDDKGKDNNLDNQDSNILKIKSKNDSHEAFYHFTGMISIMTLLILILGIISLIVYIIFA